MTNLFSLLLLLCAFTWGCESDYYSMEDFFKVEKIDAHFHIYTNDNSSLEQARKDNFKLYAINTYSDGCEQVVQAQNWLSELKKASPEEVGFSTTFCLEGWDNPAWVENTLSWIDNCVEGGANAVKVWKNIGMEWRDKDSLLIMIDNPKFDPVFKHLAKNGIVLIGHLGEPKNCWLPNEKMTTNTDKRYFSRHPEYHMYKHPEFPSYEEQIAARDKMLDKNPDLVFVGCHLASLEWSVDTLAEFLDRFPNAAVDMAARMGELFNQTKNDREKVRNFFMKYQDRLLYGTDVTDRGQDKEQLQKTLHEAWMQGWEYFVTDHAMTSKMIDGEFRGLKLPKEVVDKIFAGNAKKWYKLF